jgi:hypothetical protein
MKTLLISLFLLLAGFGRAAKLVELYIDQSPTVNHRQRQSNAVRQLHEIVIVTLNQKPAGKCTDVRNVLSRVARLHRTSRSGSSPFSPVAPVASMVYSDMASSCAPLAMYREDVARGRIFIVVRPCVKANSGMSQAFSVELPKHTK